MSLLLFNWYAMLASFLGTSVEFVEALTIILAVGTVRGWRTSLAGALTAIVILIVLVFGIGESLVQFIHLFWVQLIVGLFMLLFGIRWLRKAILRYSGLKALHDETESYEEEVERQRKAGENKKGIDSFGFMTTLSITFLEGLEAIFIVLTLGSSSQTADTGLMQYTILGAVVAVIVVLAAGLILRKPLASVPENSMKFIVGVMLTSFGAFWVGEAIGVDWPQADLSIVYMTITLLLFSWLTVKRCKRQMGQSSRITEMQKEVM
ncbi:COG4280 domain-containing protein [Paenibacillus aestuarii]|uniref:COG4280 domain-containing protein n=1 Tax=Paenibacillus aestuarii TaxID=516965 RepID=A0ABW0KI80_9BACL